MKVLVTGVNGQLGHDMMLELAQRGHDPVGSGSGPSYRGTDRVASMPYEQMNIADGQDVRKVMEKVHPDAVVHCSAWTAVDAAEEEENREKVDRLILSDDLTAAYGLQEGEGKTVYVSPRALNQTAAAEEYGFRLVPIA